MFDSVKFIRNFLIGCSVCIFLFFIYYLLAYKIGEVNVEYVVERQISNKNRILFSSGLNQSAFPYKKILMEKVEPEVVALGSSRAMQIRGEYIRGKFVNLGGMIQGVTDLEDYAEFIGVNPAKPLLTLFFVDPWWFNLQFARDGGSHQLAYPRMISLDHLSESLALLKRGNWFIKSFKTENLGIAAILTGEGFSNDGSYHYTSLISASGFAEDVNFENTLERIKNGNNRFEKGAHPDSVLMARACSAIHRIKSNTKSMVLVAPPFANIIWNRLKNDRDYSYMQESYAQLEKCLGQQVYRYLSMDVVKSSNDCEFIDGYHGGDTIYAKIMLDLAAKNNDVNIHSDSNYLRGFIEKESGYAAGITRHLSPDAKEVDFLKLGCKK